MDQEQHDYEQGCAAQAEYEFQMAYNEYLDGLIKDKKYKLHAIEITLNMLKSIKYINSGLSPKDYLDSERKRLAVKSLNNNNESF